LNQESHEPSISGRKPIRIIESVSALNGSSSQEPEVDSEAETEVTNHDLEEIQSEIELEDVKPTNMDIMIESVRHESQGWQVESNTDQTNQEVDNQESNQSPGPIEAIDAKAESGWKKECLDLLDTLISDPENSREFRY